ncbi:hypothetical protein RhiJN_13533 [Ceratobasidium sp. AG-Ba]|nr:hypothetical protein RhiJN_13533 [Ceratobasidium sp. AG-Ba]
MENNSAAYPARLRRNNIRGGTTLLASGAAALINIPAVDSLARQAQDWLKSLKPHVLQVPEQNDRGVQDQAARIEEYAKLLDNIGSVTGDFSSYHTGDMDSFLFQMQVFDDYLTSVRKDLLSLQQQQYSTKFSNEVEIRSYLERKKAGISDQTISFCLRNGLTTSHLAARSHEQATQRLDEFLSHTDSRFESLERQLSALQSVGAGGANEPE